ncbi:DNA polymerase Y family protein [Methylopila musalis]|uniref:DNA polymerase Y family protein n=1 Tax=Methylopila musalis TaxID=1134781 RepID=A0ABW3Z943_9HYPH
MERLERARRRSGAAPVDGPAVLYAPTRNGLAIAAANRVALALGLAPGLALADARARAPDMRTDEHRPDDDAALLRSLAVACERWTPLVALDPPDGLMLDVTGCAHLFGGEAGLLRDVVVWCRSAGFSARVALAGTPDAAGALARFGKGGIVPAGDEAEALRPLPVATLRLAKDERRSLALAGLKNLGDLADLPGPALTARFGAGLTERLHRVLGRDDLRITPLRPPPAIHEDARFAEPLAHHEAILAALGDLAGRAAIRLEAAGQGGRRFEAMFFRSDGGARRLSVTTGRPSRDPRAILRLFHETLDALADPLDPGFGFDLIRFAVSATEPLGQAQPALDGERPQEETLAELVDRLTARFGSDRVLRFRFEDTHDPVRASRLARVADAGRADADGSAPADGEPQSRPLQLFDPPQPIETLAETPDGPPLRFRWRRAQHRVVRAEGPERIAPEWWRAPGRPTRDYYRVEDDEGRRFWLYRDGLYGRETGEPRWYLHGLFA